MDMQLSSEQKMLIETVRRFVQNELLPLEDEIEATHVLAPEKARTLFEKSKENGLYAMNIPEKFGGGGLSAVDTMLCEEQFGHAKDILIRRAFGNVYEMLLECNPEQVEIYLKPCTAGERTGAICITEPNAGSDAAAIKTRAVKDGDGWILNGNKIFISDALYSDFFLVSAVTDPSKGAKGISMFLVDKDTPGFIMGRGQKMMGLSGTSHYEIFFENLRLKPINLLGQENDGFRLIMTTLGRVRLGQVSARAVGKASRLLKYMVDYAKERKQFGKAIGEFQFIQGMLADSTMEINAARWMVLDAATAIDNGTDPRGTKISMVKVYAAETLGRVADRAVQVFGGMGYCSELPIERLYRDSRIFRIFDGTSEIHRVVVANAVMRNGEALFGPGGI